MGGAPGVPPETEVRNEDWDGRDLSGETHPRMAFIDVDLTETTGAGAAFTDCTFRNCRFNCSRHRDAAFTNCTFANCDLFDVRFTAAKFVGSSFTRCSFNQLTVVGGDWSFVGLAEADLRRASFTGTRMREADLIARACRVLAFGTSTFPVPRWTPPTCRDATCAAPTCRP